MAAIGVGFVFVLFVVAAPLALYWFVREEDPDPGQTTSWGEARERATEDHFGGGGRADDDRNARRDSDRDHGTRSNRGDRRDSGHDRRTRSNRGDRRDSDRDDRDDGNHWG
jgi:hypothetical protein